MNLGGYSGLNEKNRYLYIWQNKIIQYFRD